MKLYLLVHGIHMHHDHEFYHIIIIHIIIHYYVASNDILGCDILQTHIS